MEAVNKFFEENPKADVCYVALGKVMPTLEEAEALLGGVYGVKPEMHGRPAETELTQPNGPDNLDPAVDSPVPGDQPAADEDPAKEELKEDPADEQAGALAD